MHQHMDGAIVAGAVVGAQQNHLWMGKRMVRNGSWGICLSCGMATSWIDHSGENLIAHLDEAAVPHEKLSGLGGAQDLRDVERWGCGEV